MPITSCLFRNCSPKDVAAFVLVDVGAAKDIVTIIPVPGGGFIFCYG